MGHRALVAYRRPDRLYDLRYSHWGGADLSLAEAIDDGSPLADGTVDAGLLADSIARERILTGYLDPCIYEALYLVAPGREYAVDAYRVCWLEWGDGRDGGRGAIVAADPSADEPRIRTWFRATKTTLGDAVEMGALSRRAAQAYLEARVCEDEDGTVYTYTGRGTENGTRDGSAGDGDAYEPTPDRWLERDRGPEADVDREFGDPDSNGDRDDRDRDGVG
ncbi:hypothetical protein SAMN05444422_10863 [Halobiforma haloterrestris]|uniref:Uncharacterized protein n=1 Tax=Natronobacterium haloterrestre TaxID=148448 RepID=A0A1I1IZT0_NATHA|nr:DUF6735 family protein [Halobiforma haloterrestris]SFC41839.1 hypothetical protein SAMN05444422_10863 [Halobiforma haloterrestris]